VRRSAFILLFLTTTILIGCNKQQSAATTASTQPSTAAQSANWKIALTTDPAKPEEENDTAFKVALTDSSGQPVSGAAVTADLQMQTMNMGKNEITLIDDGAGTYEGKSQFSMAGPWNVIVTAKQGGKTAQQTFQVVAYKK
jgi:nitrogen fixation protein FixH